MNAALWTVSQLVRDFDGATRHPKIARAVLFVRSSFADPFLRAFVLALLCNGGAWAPAVDDLRRQGQPLARVAKLRRWCEKQTARPVRGLLEWKGGAA